MFKNLEETAKDLGMPEHQILQYIYSGRIKAIPEGNDFLINSQQFDLYHEQLERIKEEIEIWRNTPIPEDIDVKDED